MVRDHDLILFERKRLWPGLKNECAWHVIKILSILMTWANREGFLTYDR
jgi:hypothetical protein